MTQTRLVPTYSIELYNSIGSISQAYATFRWLGGFQFLEDVLKPLLGFNKLEKQFGFGLLHRHSTLNKKDHKFVEYNNSTSPWDSDAEVLGGKIVAHAWMIVDGKLVPYEFKFTPFGEDTAEIDFEGEDHMSELAERFVDVVIAAGLERAVCLRRHPGSQNKGGMEMTVGETNIILKKDQVPESTIANSIRTQWFFDPDLEGVEWLCDHRPDPSTN